VNQHAVFLFSLLVIVLSACGSPQPAATAIQEPTNMPTLAISSTLVSEQTQEMETLQAIPTFTLLSGPCATPDTNQFSDFLFNSITSEDSGKTFTTHVTSRFWIYLDDRIYPLRDLLAAIPDGLIGYISNGSMFGPQCYPTMFEAVHEGKGILKIKDFQLSVIIDNNLPMSVLPLH
jgi:hypothetical protein